MVLEFSHHQTCYRFVVPARFLFSVLSFHHLSQNRVLHVVLQPRRDRQPNFKPKDPICPALHESTSFTSSIQHDSQTLQPAPLGRAAAPMHGVESIADGSRHSAAPFFPALSSLRENSIASSELRAKDTSQRQASQPPMGDKRNTRNTPVTPANGISANVQNWRPAFLAS
jgi:hypothetical protein